MYNFGMSSTLKAWFDHVLRAGVTFRYTESGPEGLLKGKKAVVIESRGGLYSEGPAAAMNAQEAHIRTLLGFAGIDDVTFVLCREARVRSGSGRGLGPGRVRTTGQLRAGRTGACRLSRLRGIRR